MINGFNKFFNWIKILAQTNLKVLEIYKFSGTVDGEDYPSHLDYPWRPR